MSDIKSYTLAEIAQEYKVTTKTLRIWIYPIKDELISMYPRKQKRLRTLFPRQVKRIYEYLG
jgi:DNA-directed RNA polymerase specialized sigma24 family protein